MYIFGLAIGQARVCMEAYLGIIILYIKMYVSITNLKDWRNFNQTWYKCFLRSGNKPCGGESLLQLLWLGADGVEF